MRETIVVLGIFAVAFTLGPYLAQGDNSTPISTPIANPVTISVPTSTPTPDGVLYENTDLGIGQVNINSSKPFTVYITANCSPSRDYQTTYMDDMTHGNKYVMYGSKFNRQYTFGAGTYEFYIDNNCPNTHVLVQ